jgi:hypothetical protein
MDHSRVPVPEALEEFRRRGDVVSGPPGHQQCLGADPRVLDLVGEEVFASDVLSLNGLDDRRESQGVLAQAEELMADAGGADPAFFSTCGVDEPETRLAGGVPAAWRGERERPALRTSRRRGPIRPGVCGGHGRSRDPGSDGETGDEGPDQRSVNETRTAHRRLHQVRRRSVRTHRPSQRTCLCATVPPGVSSFG